MAVSFLSRRCSGGKHISRHRITFAIVMMACTASVSAQISSAVHPESGPPFWIRARVVKSDASGSSSAIFTYRWGKQIVKSQANVWSPWLDPLRAEANAALQKYQSPQSRQSPVVIGLQVSPVVNPTSVQIQVSFSGKKTYAELSEDLFGPIFGLVIWKDGGSAVPHAATMAAYNQRYWPEFDRAALPASQRPRRFLIVDRFVGGDDDLLDWQQGLSHLAKIGINTMLVPPLQPLRGMLEKDGVQRIGLAVYAPPGDALGIGTKVPPLDQWASNLAANYFKAGYSPSEFSIMALADEPGWYFPMILKAVEEAPASLEAFRSYLAQQGLTPPMLGATNWSQVDPIGHGGVSSDTPLATRRLFYWTCRFLPWKAAQYMRSVTDQLHRTITPQLEIFSNFNNFADQFYFEGFAAHNPSPHSPDAAMGTPDWFQFGHMRGADLMWTEDWFANNRAYQWSYYASKFNSIALQSGLGFGGYVIGRADGDPPEGLVQRILALIGNGAKAVYYYNFGPEYNWPGNCYSEVRGVPTQLAQADRMIAKSEDLLWPGQKPPAQVAILEPRSSEVWDGMYLPRGSGVVGVTNNNPNGSTFDYMAEEYDEYLALEMSDIPVDFLDEDELTDARLSHYKLLYITEPDIPLRGQRAIAQWVESGGALAMAPGAAEGDRYDEPAKILTSLAESSLHERSYLRNLFSIKKIETIGNVPVFGEAVNPLPKGRVLQYFDDHIPAVTEHEVGKGQILSFSWFSGLSYARVTLGPKLGLHDTVDANAMRELVLKPVRAAGVESSVQVNTPYVETPILKSAEGEAITLLNWTGHDLPALKVRVSVPFRVSSATSADRGRITFERQGGTVVFSLPLGAADVVELRNAGTP